VVYSEGGSVLNPPVQAGFLTDELSCETAVFPEQAPVTNYVKINMISAVTMISAATDFEYSKDWLVTDSHRLSFYHVLGRAPAELCIHPFD
jgi:hypothetical protein